MTLTVIDLRNQIPKLDWIVSIIIEIATSQCWTSIIERFSESRKETSVFIEFWKGTQNWNYYIVGYNNKQMSGLLSSAKICDFERNVEAKCEEPKIEGERRPRKVLRLMLVRSDLGFVTALHYHIALAEGTRPALVESRSIMLPNKKVRSRANSKSKTTF